MKFRELGIYEQTRGSFHFAYATCKIWILAAALIAALCATAFFSEALANDGDTVRHVVKACMKESSLKQAPKISCHESDGEIQVDLAGRRVFSDDIWIDFDRPTEIQEDPVDDQKGRTTYKIVTRWHYENLMLSEDRTVEVFTSPIDNQGKIENWHNVKKHTYTFDDTGECIKYSTDEVYHEKNDGLTQEVTGQSPTCFGQVIFPISKPINLSVNDKNRSEIKDPQDCIHLSPVGPAINGRQHYLVTNTCLFGVNFVWAGFGKSSAKQSAHLGLLDSKGKTNITSFGTAPKIAWACGTNEKACSVSATAEMVKTVNNRPVAVKKAQ